MYKRYFGNSDGHEATLKVLKLKKSNNILGKY